MPNPSAACSLALFTLLASGCGGGGTTEAPIPEPATPTSTPQPAEAPATPPPAPEAPPAAAPPAAAAPAFPIVDALPADAPNAAWTVYAVVAEPETPALQAEFQRLTAAGSEAGLGEVGCDTGAREALHASETAHAVSVQFPTREAAEAFATTLPAPPAGIVHVVPGCAD